MEFVPAWLTDVVTLLFIVVASLASYHVLLYKRNPRSAVGWIALIWLSPFIGAICYGILGVNRLRKKALKLNHPEKTTGSLPSPDSSQQLPADLGRRRTLLSLVDGIVPYPLTAGNRITPLIDGDQAYPAMLQAINEAKASVSLSSYIFDNDSLGQQFVTALKEAKNRGVNVRVLIDDVGCRYSWPPITYYLRRANIKTARFLPTKLPWRLGYLNLRNHRKILVADGGLAFVGGLNIRRHHLVSEKSKHTTQDLHFCIAGPVVEQIQRVFMADWEFTTGEHLQERLWINKAAASGSISARAIASGAGDQFETIQWTLLGAIKNARQTIRIVTPYFLPDYALIASLSLAAKSGVKVEIILPQVNNLKVVQWASNTLLPSLVEEGSAIYLSPPPFDHSKLMLIDDYWSFFGSSNWDARSLRLNFELNIECYDKSLNSTLTEIFDNKLAAARKLRKQDLMARPIPLRLRDGVARLLMPYL